MRYLEIRLRGVDNKSYKLERLVHNSIGGGCHNEMKKQGRSWKKTFLRREKCGGTG